MYISKSDCRPAEAASAPAIPPTNAPGNMQALADLKSISRRSILVKVAKQDLDPY